MHELKQMKIGAKNMQSCHQKSGTISWVVILLVCFAVTAGSLDAVKTASVWRHVVRVPKQVSTSAEAVDSAPATDEEAHTRAITVATTKEPTDAQVQQNIVKSFMDNMPFSQGVYDERQDFLYLLAQAAGNATAESLNKIVFDSINRSMKQQSFADPIISLNGTAVVNPIYQATLDATSKIALVGNNNYRWPVVTFEKAGETGKVFLFQSGNVVLSTPTPLADAAGEPIDKVPVALAGNRDSINPVIFAAVPQQGATWAAGDNRGIAIVQQSGTSLAQLNLMRPAGKTASAQKIPLDGAPVKFGATANVTVGNNVDLSWSQDLQRLFIGLSDVGKADANDGGGVSVLVGELTSTGGFNIRSIVQNQAAVFTPDSPHFAIGFNEINGTNDLVATTSKVRSMYTNNGRNYVIVNGGAMTIPIAGGVTSANLNSWVQALPLVGTTDKNGVAMPAANVGVLAKVATNATTGQLANVNFDTPASAAGDILAIDQSAIAAPNFSFRAAVVGEDPRIIGGAETQVPIEDLQVIGNSVYAATQDVSTAAAHNVQPGIYASTAIFAPLSRDDHKKTVGGHIVGWTRWAPVGGNLDKTYIFGIDRSTAASRYVSDGTAAGTVFPRAAIKSSFWGTSNDVVSDATTSRHLTDVLEKIFAAQNGVYKLTEFDRQTSGFVQDANRFPQGQFAMITALSNNQVALVETLTGGVPTANFSVAATIAQFQGGQLDNIAPLTTAEVSRSINPNEGYLFVGGLHGLARLEQAGPNGWNGAVGLDKVATVAGSTFRQIAEDSITDRVIALAAVPDTTAGNSRMLVLTDDFSQTCTGNNACKLFKIDLDGVVQAHATGAAEPVTLPFGTDMKRVTIVDADGANNNAVLGIVATLSGVFVIDATQALDGNDFALENALTNAVEFNTDGTIDVNQALRGVPIQLQVVNQNGRMPLIYLLTGDYDGLQSYVYQFDIDLAQAARVANAAVPADRRVAARRVFVPRRIDILPIFRTAFATDGSTFLYADSKNFSSSDLLYTKVYDPLMPNNLFLLTSLLNQRDALRMFAPVKDTVRGTWITDGSNVRVNE